MHRPGEANDTCVLAQGLRNAHPHMPIGFVRSFHAKPNVRRTTMNRKPANESDTPPRPRILFGQGPMAAWEDSIARALQ